MTCNPFDSAKVTDKPTMTDPQQKIIREAITRWLARREHSLRELREKCISKGFDASEIEPQLAWFVSHDLQSDQRFAESVVRHRAGRGFGPVRVRAELREHRIADELIQAAFADTEVDWFAAARRSYQKKYGDAPPQGREEAFKCRRFLQYRGYDAEQIQYALNPDS